MFPSVPVPLTVLLSPLSSPGLPSRLVPHAAVAVLLMVPTSVPLVPLVRLIVVRHLADLRRA